MAVPAMCSTGVSPVFLFPFFFCVSSYFTKRKKKKQKKPRAGRP